MPDHYYQFLRESLNNDYDTYFTDQPNPDDILGVVAPLVCFHYNNVLFDRTLRDSRACGKNKELHIFSLEAPHGSGRGRSDRHFVSTYNF